MIVMVQGTIKLGVTKRPLGKSLPCAKLEGFFIGGGLKWHTGLSERSNSTRERYVVVGDGFGLTPLKRCRKQSMRRPTPARQAPNFSDNLCAGWRGSQTICGVQQGLTFAQMPRLSYRCRPTAPAHLFYDIPSSKRDVRGTNNLHTGATLSGVGEGQRLRKGFQGQQKRGSFTYGSNPFQFESWEWPSDQFKLSPHWLRRSRPTAWPGSLSSAAEIRHIGEEYEVTRDSPSPCLYS